MGFIITDTRELELSDHLPSSHPSVTFGKVGILLVNLGTPDATDKKSMKVYLKEFLSDRRVIETPRIIWWPLLNFVILRTRPEKSGALYASIWNKELDESPLRTYTRSQSDKLSDRLGKYSNVIVDWAMRYGNPSIESRIKRLKEQGCDRLIVFPLYPQYSAATTATVSDSVFKALMKMRWMPTLRTVPPYYDTPAYIESLGKSIKNYLSTLDFVPKKIVASYHGIPKSYFDNGDPYHCHCQKTSRLLKEYMDWPDDYLLTTFQSRFGPEEWLQPYTDETINNLAKDGIDDIAVLTAGFAVDCLETLEEIATEAKAEFIHHGGTNFAHIPCLNDSDLSIDLLEKIIVSESSNWLD